MPASDTPEIIARAVAFLRDTQLPDGSIAGTSSTSRRPFKPQITYHTTFTPALILAALSSVAETAEIRSRLAEWLRAQRSAAWSFNYWARASKEYATLSYPDDLDDTFCALIGLYLHDAQLITADVLGHVVRLLIATEATVGGPYRTWLATPDSDAIWKDVDLAVNSNIAYFLRQVAQPLPNLTAYLEQTITSGSFSSPYYPSATPLLYYVARAYRGPQEALLAAHIRKQRVATPLATALIISSLLELGHHAELGPAVAKLRSWQQTDGSWPAEAYCIDPTRRGKTFYHGSKALTTAFALEAITRYAQHQPVYESNRHTPLPSADDSIIKTAINATKDLDEPVRSHIATLIHTTAQGDETHEITGIPRLFMQSLHDTPALPASLLTQLGAANLFGWMAYTIYDDFLDDTGDASLLSVANISLRRSLEGYLQAMPADTAFQKHVHRTFDTIDAANAWEIAHCRFTTAQHTISIAPLPDYGNRKRLAERSLGHTLAPTAILCAIGYPPDSPQSKAVHRMLTHYLIARQLNDDMHDWEQDMRRGHISYAVQAILQALDKPPGAQELDNLVAEAQRQFWHHSLPILCDRTARHINLARMAAHASGIIGAQTPLLSLLDHLESVVTRTRSEQRKAEAFLQAYQNQ